MSNASMIQFNLYIVKKKESGVQESVQINNPDSYLPWLGHY